MPRADNSIAYMEHNEQRTLNVLITGASRGIGFEVARRFAALGNHNIVAVARTEEGLRQLKNASIKENVQAHLYPVPFDLSSPEPYTQALLPQIAQHVEHLDIVINNAGSLVNRPFVELSEAEMAEMMQVNFLAAARLTRAVLPMMRNGGHVLNVSSMGGFQGSQKFGGLAMYSAAKAALVALTECLAEEYRGQGIAFNCLALGSVDTEMFRRAFPGMQAQQPSADMAQLIADFAIGGPRFFNGKVLPVSISTP